LISIAGIEVVRRLATMLKEAFGLIALSRAMEERSNDTPEHNAMAEADEMARSAFAPAQCTNRRRNGTCAAALLLCCSAAQRGRRPHRP